ncbi:MAG: hypothetical protein AB1896_02685 [Thermodesulfobacteriota bacterium]
MSKSFFAGLVLIMGLAATGIVAWTTWNLYFSIILLGATIAGCVSILVHKPRRSEARAGGVGPGDSHLAGSRG